SLAEIEDPRLKKDRFQGMVEVAKNLSSPLMPQSEGEQGELRNRLANAGFRSESAVSVYLGIRFATLMIFFLLGAAIFLPKNGLTWAGLKPVVFFVAIGFYLPSSILWF